MPSMNGPGDMTIVLLVLMTEEITDLVYMRMGLMTTGRLHKYKDNTHLSHMSPGSNQYGITFVAPAVAGRHRRASFRLFVRSSVRPSVNI